MHSVKYAYIEVYFSINNENILVQTNDYKVFRRLWPSKLACISPVPYGKFV